METEESRKTATNHSAIVTSNPPTGRKTVEFFC